ncbi:hypothetical protein RHGRI_028679 [Rhododendron griersonianum]|uniref:Uncharacterized protein n=1 Tax=Rhododendron griersonianum TaxID=479676 RepID=A0AAV6IJX3_9ERIC|nr:hypothetical protein RHGRI_028679 [Rhododendron griersonianum]
MTSNAFLSDTLLIQLFSISNDASLLWPNSSLGFVVTGPTLQLQCLWIVNCRTAGSRLPVRLQSALISFHDHNFSNNGWESWDTHLEL